MAVAVAADVGTVASAGLAGLEALEIDPVGDVDRVGRVERAGEALGALVVEDDQVADLGQGPGHAHAQEFVAPGVGPVPPAVAAGEVPVEFVEQHLDAVEGAGGVLGEQAGMLGQGLFAGLQLLVPGHQDVHHEGDQYQEDGEQPVGVQHRVGRARVVLASGVAAQGGEEGRRARARLDRFGRRGRGRRCGMGGHGEEFGQGAGRGKRARSP